MTENEVKGFIQGKLNCMNKCDVFDCKGTDECDNCEYCYSQGNFGEQKKAFEKAIQTLEEIQQYRAIGTVEEFKDLKEKSVAKKVTNIHEPQNTEEMRFYGEDTLFGYCPECGELLCSLWNITNCGDCGQELDWQ